MHQTPQVDSLAKRYLASVLTGRTDDALDLLVDEGLSCAVPVQRLYLDVVQPAQREVGRLWQHGRISVAEEHAATIVARRALARLREHLPCTAPNGTLVLVACVEGELHDLGAQTVADFLEMGGFDVCFLGADVPLQSLLAIVSDRTPAVVALSATTRQTVPALRRAVAALRSRGRRAIRVAAGGLAFGAEAGLWKALELDAHAADAAEAVVAIRLALGR